MHIPPLHRRRSANELPRTARQQLAGCIMLAPSDRDERLMVGSRFASSRGGSTVSSFVRSPSAGERLGCSPLLHGQRMSAAFAQMPSCQMYNSLPSRPSIPLDASSSCSSRPSDRFDGLRARGSSHEPRSTNGLDTDRFSVECRPRGSSAGPRMAYGQSGSSRGRRDSSFSGMASQHPTAVHSRSSSNDRVSCNSVREESPWAMQQEMEQEMGQKEQQLQTQQVPRDLAVSASDLSKGVSIGPMSPLTRVHVPVIEEAAAVEMAYDDAASEPSEPSVEVEAVEVDTYAAEVEARRSVDQEVDQEPSKRPPFPQRTPLKEFFAGSSPRRSTVEGTGSSRRRSTVEEPSRGGQQFRRSDCFAAEL